jgi:uncharacterized protein YukE
MALTDGDLQKIGSLFQLRFAALEASMATNADVQQTGSELLETIHSQTAHLAQAIDESAQRYVRQEEYARLQQRVEELEELLQSLGPPAV